MKEKQAGDDGAVFLMSGVLLNLLLSRAPLPLPGQVTVHADAHLVTDSRGRRAPDGFIYVESRPRVVLYLGCAVTAGAVLKPTIQSYSVVAKRRGAGITPGDRKIDWDRIAEAALQAIAVRLSEALPGDLSALVALSEADVSKLSAEGHQLATARPRRGRRPIDAARLNRSAELYQAARDSRAAVAAIQEEYGVGESTAWRYIQRARAEGLIDEED